MKQDNQLDHTKAMRYTLKIIFKTVCNGIFKPGKDMELPFKTKKEALEFHEVMVDDTVLHSILYDNSNNTCLPLN